MQATQVDELIFCHELGHVAFNLFHPDDYYGRLVDKVNPEWDQDNNNFMNSGETKKRIGPNTPSTVNIRQYQWHKMYQP